MNSGWPASHPLFILLQSMTEPTQPATSLALTGHQRPGLHPALLSALFAILVFTFALSLTLGSVRIPLDNVARILLGGTPDRQTWTDIIFKFRLPKALTATLAGAALAVSGLQMQTLFRNPLADPFILGVSSGASLGVALIVLSTGATGLLLVGGLGLFGELGLAAAASLGAALALALVLVISRRIPSTLTLLVIGVMLGYLTSAMVSLLVYFSSPERVQAFAIWSAGSFGGITWSQMRAFAPVVGLGLLMAGVLPKTLNALLLGETYAHTLGLNVRQARFGIITSASLLAGTVTAFCGPIGFIGVAVPHLCRALFNTADHHILVPASILVGAILALLADIIAQMPGGQTVLPLNVITSLFGVPIILWIITHQRQLKGALAA